MIGNFSISLVMPCRDEEENLQRIIDTVPDFYDEIIVVSNASIDATYETGKRLAMHNSRLHMLEDNRTHNGIGYGFAHMSGIAHASCDVIVCADCDGTYPLQDVPRLLREMFIKGCCFATCSRYPDSRIPKMLQLGVHVLNAEIWLLYRLHMSDSLSGMWVFLRDVVPYLRLTEGDWNLSLQIKLNAFTHFGNLACELSIKQAAERIGHTKQRYLVTGFRHLMWVASNYISVNNKYPAPKQLLKSVKRGPGLLFRRLGEW